MCEKTKVCKKCGVEKLIKNFAYCKESGRKDVCKSCATSATAGRVKIFKETKCCTICKEEKKLEDFHKSERGLYGREAICKSCKHEKAKVRQRLKPKYAPPVGFKRCRKCKTDKLFCEFGEGYCIDGLRQDCVQCYTPPMPKNKSEEKVALDKFKKNTRSLVCQSFKRACNGTYVKSQRTEEILGCSMEEFMVHIESQFTEGMSWENHGQCRKGDCYVWHVDHRIPLATAETEEDIIKLCHYTNLHPMWALENIVKGNKII